MEDKNMILINRDDFMEAIATAMDNIMKKDTLSDGAKLSISLTSIIIGHEIMDVLFKDETEKENENV